jgi:hypothetical protein
MALERETGRSESALPRDDVEVPRDGAVILDRLLALLTSPEVVPLQRLTRTRLPALTASGGSDFGIAGAAARDGVPCGTCDLLAGCGWWALQDSNLRSRACEAADQDQVRSLVRLSHRSVSGTPSLDAIDS